MAVHSNMAVHGLLQAEGAGAGGPEQPENENQSQMDLYDDLINDIIGVPLNNGFKPENNNCSLLPKCSSSNIIVPTTAAPTRAAPSKYFVPATVVPLLPEKKTLLIGNLTWWTTTDDLVASIRSAGVFNVDKIRIYEVPKGGQSKGFAKVDLSSEWDMNRLLEMLPKRKIHERVPDVRPYSVASRQYFETQFINAVEKSKLYSAEDDVFDGYDGNDGQSAFDSSRETIPGDSTLQDQTPSPFEQLSVKSTASIIESKLHPGSSISPNFLLQDFISLDVSSTSIPGLGLGGRSRSQSLHTACTDPATFIPPTNTSISPLENKKSPVFNAYYKDYRILGREPGFQETLQSKEITKELDRKGTILTSNDESKDDCSEDYGSLLRLVSFVKKSKAVAQDNYRDSLNCPPNQLHGGESKQFSSGLREHEYLRRKENQRSGERSGSVRDRSRSPCSSDGHYQEKKMDYDQERQQNHQRIHCEYSPRRDHHSDRSRDHHSDRSRDHHSDRSRDQRDSFGQERPCDSVRYTSRNIDPWHVYSEKSGKGQDYSQEKYFRKKREKDREYQF
ncbi:cleavage and polyadenylation specificity factor subunit 6-like [Pristis pectinata]|uniref:cleavage and polyadenylation specificity factor subunit 6-like n=1 Tax=Pristis pectinata TaxID=685728 RepID=UPI00223E61F7|nr:cleavage and polyadenylation specificity factor subunit 6-like [Pristis pectinata]